MPYDSCPLLISFLEHLRTLRLQETSDFMGKGNSERYKLTSTFKTTKIRSFVHSIARGSALLNNRTSGSTAFFRSCGMSL